MSEISHHYIKLTGKANIPEGLVNGSAYEILAKGEITSETFSNNQDGTFTGYYKFEPIIVEVTNDLGKTVKAEDTRSMSSKLRKRLWKVWNDTPDDRRDFDTAYEETMNYLLSVAPHIYERARGE